MEHLCRQGTGLFPTPAEIQFTCSCPDWASMCKHVAAVLYGVGARLDHSPELLFRLRHVNEQDLIARAGTDAPLSRKGPAAAKVLTDTDLAGVFGVELAPPAPARSATAGRRASVAPPVAARTAKPTAALQRRRTQAVPAVPAATPTSPQSAGNAGQPVPGRRTRPPRPEMPLAPSSGDKAEGRKAMTTAQRKAVSERMRRYWEERRRR
jgi:hypothetical protein